MIRLEFPFKLISKDNEKVMNRQGRYFLSKKFKEWERVVQIYAIKQYGRLPVLNGNIEFSLYACFKDKRHSDATNLFKGVCDALQGIIYKNDRQIKIAHVRYDYYNLDGFVVEIKEI